MPSRPPVREAHQRNHEDHGFKRNLDLTLLTAHLDAGALGSYLTNQGLIKLSRDASFWLEENEPTLARFGVFLHEYAHFLHNFSTVAGIYEFVSQVRLLKLFMHTVGASGRSHGSSALNAGEQQELAAVTEWHRHLAGDMKQPYSALHRRSDTLLSVRDIRQAQRSIHLGARDVLLGQVEVKLAVNSASLPV